MCDGRDSQRTADVKAKRKRYSQGEVRFRVSKTDLERIAWLLNHAPEQINTTSALIRTLIFREYERLQPKTGD